MLDALVRRRIVSTLAVVDFVFKPAPADTSSLPPHALHVSRMGSDVWVWSVAELALDRALDTLLVAVDLYNSKTRATGAVEESRCAFCPSAQSLLK